ncbi:hypothetical protein [Sphingobium sp. B2]|uniref:hypothetical protein n=1 Tax=Sphingobium sp. B2 TaxID=2583228 RepID=UPI0021BD7B58|nr:hypothetical protein [Sphingobium sp. B2]
MHVATFLQDLAGGGAERVAVLLMNGLVVRGERVTLILARREGPCLDDLDPAIELVDLGNRRSISSIRPLARLPACCVRCDPIFSSAISPMLMSPLRWPTGSHGRAPRMWRSNTIRWGRIMRC